MTRLIAGALCIAFLLLPAVQAEGDASQRPDIVFIIVDDLNDWIGCLGGHLMHRVLTSMRLPKTGCCFRKPTAMPLSAGPLERACCMAPILSIQELILMPNLPKKLGH